MAEQERVAGSQALATLFEGKEIRVIEKGDDLWIPVIDLSNAWEIDRTTPLNIISRNAETFEGMVSGGDITSQVGTKCLNEFGLYMMMAKVSTCRLKNKKAKEVIVRFQRWLPELVRNHRKGTIQSQLPAPDPVALALDRGAEYRTRLIKLYEFDPKEATAICLGVIQKETGVSFELPKPSVISRSDGSGNWMSPTDLGRECGLTGEQVNQWLYNHKLQYPTWDGPRKIWRLTTEGEEYGEEYPMELSSKHTEIRIRWHSSVKDFAPGIKRHAEQAPIIVA
jgi:hypothetical protein